MENKHIQIECPNGTIRGNFTSCGTDSPLVLMACGHNGFYHFGMFPTIQRLLAEKGISSVAFNYTHCGISDDGDYFNDLEGYKANCRRLEVEDLTFMAKEIATNPLFHKPDHLFLLGHSMGGFSVVFASKTIQNSGIELAGIILLNALRTLDVRTPEIMEEWKANGVYFRSNMRTKQELPQGPEFLAETLASGTTWNMQPIVEKLTIPCFVAHAVDDESVPFEHGRTIFSWVYKNNSQNAFLPIPNAGHTLNTTHPMKRDSEELRFFCEQVVNWIENL
ncbi:alpha/beta hydrolase family protein [Fluviicola chungangensis]|uniref:Prolyl oligopeptidase family serine peptidase n=1 Tax=Fluviicola chungangensis TaxID=2597671 RepID=A0A556N083_9FLAO|nr:alpha/beta fold hydrolase [Fluviicola chungangensis]TSJ45594.1 prolyl oligopeptidase family serine peptidase [Fluviicola chungangensis]